MALQAEQLLLLVQPYTCYFIHIRLINQSLINNTHNISMEVSFPIMLSNKQHPLRTVSANIGMFGTMKEKITD